ncbi:MAG: hypothetical protein CSA07_00015 [Bacteroidia bacterium]|nr:MAG: hypothetical protein CSA07_00015 [Bacteroidia bacterium]
MAEQLRKTLFVGVGGTGIRSILHLKRRFLLTYGKIPPMIGFLGVDTDDSKGGLRTSLHLLDEDTRLRFNDDELASEVSLNGDEMCNITVRAPQDILQRNREGFSWLPRNNERSLLNLSQGAGQVRSNGRFAIMCRSKEFKAKLNVQINKITSTKRVDDTEFTSMPGKIEVYTLGSIAGGTGSGILIDVGLQIHEQMADIGQTEYGSYAYLLLPEIFITQLGVSPASPQVANVKPNAFAASMDLDYLMEAEPSKPIEISTLEGRKQISRPVFDLVTMFDNRNEMGANVALASHIEEMMGISLSLVVRDFGNLASMWDNVITYMSGGSLSVKNKRAWVTGIGVCEAMIDTPRLRGLYSNHVMARLLGHFTSADANADNAGLANRWIDLPDVQIRENGGDQNNYMIDYLMEHPEPSYPLEGLTPGSERQDVQSYLQLVQPKPLDEQVRQKMESLSGQLWRFLTEELARPHGLGNTIEIVAELRRQVNIYLDEMNGEIAEKYQLVERLRVNIGLEHGSEGLLDELQTVAGWNPFSKGKKKELCAEICEESYRLAKEVNEIARRKGAKDVFGMLDEELNRLEHQLHDMLGTLRQLEKSKQEEASALRNPRGDKFSRDFVIDLSDALCSQHGPGVNLDEETYAESAKLLADLLGGSAEMVGRKLRAFVDQKSLLPPWSIEDRLAMMNDEELEQEARKMVVKSSPMLEFDYMGHKYEPSLVRTFVVGLPSLTSPQCTRVRQMVEKIAEDIRPTFVKTPMHDRIALLRLNAAVPVYAVSPVSTCAQFYERRMRDENSICFHIDGEIFERMTRDMFSIYPVEDTGKQSNLQLWVMGLLLGEIENANGVYRIKSKTLGSALNQYWHELHRGCYRDEAYANFCALLPKIGKELHQTLKTKVDGMGQSQYSELMQRAKAEDGVVYLSDFAQIGERSIEEMQGDKGFAGTLEQLEQEVNLIVKEVPGA